MTTNIVSKNLFDLLGNDEDGEGAPPVPTKTPVDKTAPRHGKRNVAEPAPKPATVAPRRPKEEVTGNERAFRDRDAGRGPNRDRPSEDGYRGRGRGDGRGRGRGRGRGARQGQFGDRFSRGIGGVAGDHEKQAAHGWGENTGTGEWNDEKAGEAIAAQERKEGVEAVGDETVEETAENAAPVEEEDKAKSYDDYLAEQAAKKLQLGGPLEARKANEGGSKKLEKGTAVAREAGDDYFIGGEGKAGRQRERKEKNVLALDHDIQIREREREASRGGRGGGARGRGRGDGPPRARAAGGPRGSGRGRGGATPNLSDTSAFPSLGGS